MEQLTKEHTNKARSISVRNNRVLISDELLVAVLAVAYQITPEETQIDHHQPVQLPFSIYEETKVLTEAIDDFYSNTSELNISVNELTAWYHEFNRTVYL